MYETPDELAALDGLLARSFAGAGPHLTSIIRPERRLTADDLVRYLIGVRHLVVATVTAAGEPRTSGADGLFLHGRWWFTSNASAVKARHLEARPACSVTHLRGDEVGVFAHGAVRVVRGGTAESAALVPIWVEVYGGSPESWVERPEDLRYYELVATSMFTYAFSREAFERLRDAEG
ncbi:MAG: pyridoxamine 5'-phosphate oxidase family protein [Acidimicrobiales bacterium]